jgi:SAM-dependent methyltransferase
MPQINALSTDPFDRIADYYNRLVDCYGHDSKACDYGRPQSQTIKFKVLSEVAQLGGKTVLDVGCGLGDYADYLQERFTCPIYTGIDIAPRMLEEVRLHRPTLDVRLMNILDDRMNATFDVVSANGIFYLLGEAAENQMKAIIQRMYSLAKHAVALNSLSAWASVKEPGEFYADPLETVRFCRTLSPWVVLRHDYLPHDFTIYMYRDRQS